MFLAIGTVLGAFAWPKLAPSLSLGREPVFSGQQLSIPNAKVAGISNEYISIEDANGQKGRFPLSREFRAIDANKTNQGNENLVTPVYATLKAGASGTLLLGISGYRYQALQFLQVSSPSQ